MSGSHSKSDSKPGQGEAQTFISEQTLQSSLTMLLGTQQRCHFVGFGNSGNAWMSWKGQNRTQLGDTGD